MYFSISRIFSLLNHLENCSGSNDFDGLHKLFEDICTKYEVRGFDRGINIAPQPEYKVSKKKDDSQPYFTDSLITDNIRIIQHYLKQLT
jgi:hypothetical protein